jgi:hypothetical protein
VIDGALAVVKLAGKWRFDVEDLDALIAERKSQLGSAGSTAAAISEVSRLRLAPRAGLAPFPHRRGQLGDSSVTPRRQVFDRAALKPRATDSQSGACPRTDTR